MGGANTKYSWRVPSTSMLSLTTPPAAPNKDSGRAYATAMRTKARDSGWDAISLLYPLDDAGCERLGEFEGSLRGD
jgi:hypothetical protein